MSTAAQVEDRRRRVPSREQMEARWRGGPNHVCWNIDASINRGFFWRNLSAAVPHSEGWQLARQAAAIGAAQEAGFSLMRFGGSVSYPFFRQPALRD